MTSEDDSSNGIASRSLIVVLLGLGLIAGGTVLSSWVMTDGRNLSLEDTTVETESGLELSATVYEPADVTPDDPAPAVTLIHGYGGERGTMSSFARELANRGYVVVAVDQPGHGGSDPPAFADGWGGPAALQFTRSLETTDKDRVAIVGHSMGGFAALAAAEKHPEAYQSLILLGSTWDHDFFDGVPTANETFPRNLAVVFGSYDETAPTMYGESVPANVHKSEKMKAVFGTDQPVNAETTYGSIENGTARIYTAPPTIHTWMPRSTATIEDTLDWIAVTLDEPSEDDSQSWYWASFGHVATFIGVVLVAIGTTGLAWRLLEFGKETPSLSVSGDTLSTPSIRLLAGASALPAVTLLPLYLLGMEAVPTTRLTHQEFTHGYALWAVGTIAIGAGVVHWRRGGVLETVAAFNEDRRGSLRAGAAGIAGASVAYFVAWVVWQVPGSSARAWLVGLGPLPSPRVFSALVYVWPFLGATIGLALAVSRAVNRNGESLASGFGRGVAFTSGGLVAMVVLIYVPLFAGFGIFLGPLSPLSTQILRSALLVVLATGLVVGAMNATEHPLAGGVLAGLILTWAVVISSPIHTAVPF